MSLKHPRYAISGHTTPRYNKHRRLSTQRRPNARTHIYYKTLRTNCLVAIPRRAISIGYVIVVFKTDTFALIQYKSIFACVQASLQADIIVYVQ